jgi:peptidoglycan/xylan/chitin deacetylase (PgdA/CDA1 family)
MHRTAACSLLAILSLAAGSWLGLGQPTAAEAGRLAARVPLPASLTEAAPTLVRGEPHPADPPVPLIDPAQLPDPTPFPRLNADVSTRRAWLLAEGPAHKATDGRRFVTFTFDDGPFPETTPAILDLLARHKARATFFWIGRYLDGNDDRAVTTRAVARQVVAAGHTIGNHTHDHMALTFLSHAQVLAQIDDGATSIERVTGRRPMLFRPPYGALDAWGAEQLKARGAELVLWSIEADDNRRHDSAAMADSLRAQIEYAGGGIVLLHDIRLTTIPVLATLLDWLDAHRWDPRHPERLGYEVVDLGRYMQETARAPQPYADRQELEHARGKFWRREHRGSIPRVTAGTGLSDGRDLAL